jgi:hypothetical protein
MLASVVLAWTWLVVSAKTGAVGGGVGRLASMIQRQRSVMNMDELRSSVADRHNGIPFEHSVLLLEAMLRGRHDFTAHYVDDDTVMASMVKDADSYQELSELTSITSHITYKLFGNVTYYSLDHHSAPSRHITSINDHSLVHCPRGAARSVVIDNATSSMQLHDPITDSDYPNIGDYIIGTDGGEWHRMKHVHNISLEPQAMMLRVVTGLSVSSTTGCRHATTSNIHPLELFDEVSVDMSSKKPYDMTYFQPNRQQGSQDPLRGASGARQRSSPGFAFGTEDMGGGFLAPPSVGDPMKYCSKELWGPPDLEHHYYYNPGALNGSDSVQYGSWSYDMGPSKGCVVSNHSIFNQTDRHHSLYFNYDPQWVSTRCYYSNARKRGFS